MSPLKEGFLQDEWENIKKQGPVYGTIFCHEELRNTLWNLFWDIR